MNKYQTWDKTSNYSIVICGCALIIKIFFRKYVEGIVLPILFIGVLAFIMFLVSNLMKYIIKKNHNE